MSTVRMKTPKVLGRSSVRLAMFYFGNANKFQFFFKLRRKYKRLEFQMFAYIWILWWKRQICHPHNVHLLVWSGFNKFNYNWIWFLINMLCLHTKDTQTAHLSTLDIFLFFEKGDTANEENLYEVSCIQKVKRW